jgi:anti-anti-sigma factor
MQWHDVRPRRAGEAVVLDLSGDVILEEGNSSLRKQVEALLDQQHRLIVFNLAAVTHIDSKGMADLISCHMTIVQRGGRLKLFNVAPAIRRLFERMRLGMLEIHDSEQDALGPRTSDHVA